MIVVFFLMVVQVLDVMIVVCVDCVLICSLVIDGYNDFVWEICDYYDVKVEVIDFVIDIVYLFYLFQIDILCLKKGYVGGQFWLVWILIDVVGLCVVEMMLEEIDIVCCFVVVNFKVFEFVIIVVDICCIQKVGWIVLLIGVEGGYQIDGCFLVLCEYKVFGVGYMMLMYGKSFNWVDSLIDVLCMGGFSDFGCQVVVEMNCIGMIVDVVYVFDVMMVVVIVVLKVFVIVLYFSVCVIVDVLCNIFDILFCVIGVNGGVVMVNVYFVFLLVMWCGWDCDCLVYVKLVGVFGDVYGLKVVGFLLVWDVVYFEFCVIVIDVVDYVDYIVKVVGYDYIGFGGDYDGIQGILLVGMMGVDFYFVLFVEFVWCGWSDVDMVKLLGGNIL